MGAPLFPVETIDKAMSHFHKRGELTQGDLAALMGISDNDAFRLRQSLTHRGLIRKEKTVHQITIFRALPVEPKEPPPKPKPKPKPVTAKRFDQWCEDKLRRAMIKLDGKNGIQDHHTGAVAEAMTRIGDHLPDGLFTAAEVAARASLKPRTVATTLHILGQAGIVQRKGERRHKNKSGNWSRISVWEVME